MISNAISSTRLARRSLQTVFLLCEPASSEISCRLWPPFYVYDCDVALAAPLAPLRLHKNKKWLPFVEEWKICQRRITTAAGKSASFASINMVSNDCCDRLVQEIDSPLLSRSALI